MADDQIQIKPEEILEYTGIKAKTLDEFKEQFGKTYYSENQIYKDPETKSKLFGKTLGTITTQVKQIFDDMGVELTGKDLEQPVEAVVKLGLSRVGEKFEADKTELQRTAGLTADEKIKEFQENLSKKDQKLKDYEKLLKEKAQEFEQLTATKNQELKNFKLKSVYRDAEGAIQWNPEKDEFSKKGFLTTLNEKYQIDLDDNDEPFIIDKSTGSRVKAEGSHSTFMTPADVFKMEAIKSGMAAVNKKAGLPPPVAPKPGTPPSAPAKPAPGTTAPQPFGKKVMANTRFVK